MCATSKFFADLRASCPQMEDTTKKYSTEIDNRYEEMRKKVEATMQE